MGAAVSVLAVADILLGTALPAKTEPFIGDELIGRETVVQLDSADILILAAPIVPPHRHNLAR